MIVVLFRSWNCLHSGLCNTTATPAHLSHKQQQLILAIARLNQLLIPFTMLVSLPQTFLMFSC